MKIMKRVCIKIFNGLVEQKWQKIVQASPYMSQGEKEEWVDAMNLCRINSPEDADFVRDYLAARVEASGEWNSTVWCLSSTQMEAYEWLWKCLLYVQECEKILPPDLDEESEMMMAMEDERMKEHQAAQLRNRKTWTVGGRERPMRVNVLQDSSMMTATNNDRGNDGKNNEQNKEQNKEQHKEPK